MLVGGVMQMRKFCYENGSPSQRIDQMRADGLECERRGFIGLAGVNYEMADWMVDELRRARERAERRAARHSPNGRHLNQDDGEQAT